LLVSIGSLEEERTVLKKILKVRSSNEKVDRFNKIIHFAKSVIEVTKEDKKRLLLRHSHTPQVCANVVT